MVFGGGVMFEDVIENKEKIGEEELCLCPSAWEIPEIPQPDRHEYSSLIKQIDKLTKYLLDNEFHADPKLRSNCEGSAVDLAIRLLKLYTNRYK